MKTAINDVINMSWPTIVIFICVLIMMRVVILLKGGRKNFCLHEELMKLLFIMYLLVLFQLVTSQDIAIAGGSSNFTPFREILRYDYGTSLFYSQVICNILLFIPFGYFVSRYCKIKTAFTIGTMTIITSCVIECVQHFIGRCFDVDDIILNTVGGILGFGIYKLFKVIKRKLPKCLKTDLVYNILSIIFIILAGFCVIKIM